MGQKNTDLKKKKTYLNIFHDTPICFINLISYNLHDKL